MRKVYFIILILLLPAAKLHAQYDCTFKEPFLTIDFGSSPNIPDINFFPMAGYKRVNSACPNDGYYSYESNTSGCFNGDWLTFDEDHTPGDANGRMLLVNASPSGGIFFNFLIKNLKGNTTYQLAAWMVNVCRINGGCTPLPPNILVKVRTVMGMGLAAYHTGLLTQSVKPIWRKYEGIFTTPADVDMVLLTMEDITLGGCGNDFAMDDITLQECIKPSREPKTETKLPVFTKPVVTKQTTPPVKKEVVKTVPKAQPAKTVVPPKKETVKPVTVPNAQPKKDTVAITKRTAPDKIQNIPTTIKVQPVIPVPKPILTRANPVIKSIGTGAGELVVNLYDNGEIDGDTVTIYHNNKLIVSRAALSQKAVSFRIQIDATHPRHELVMVAENLGSIPPNTSLMIATINNKRYEIFISSSEQKNAKIVIELEK